jgi:hypothetical protein
VRARFEQAGRGAERQDIERDDLYDATPPGRDPSPRPAPDPCAASRRRRCRPRRRSRAAGARSRWPRAA